MARSLRLGELQLAILRVLWRRGDATVADVHADLEPERGSALTTIATMLSKMESRGLVAHRRDGRAYRYRPLLDEEEAQRSLVDDLTRRLFAGDALELVSHLVREHEIGADDLDAIRDMVRRRAEDEREGERE